ncbi:MAG: DUF3999 family protein [Acidobacteriia bacterium]|nr:DUF3999 family protein [Terriglobia bacterium]
MKNRRVVRVRIDDDVLAHSGPIDKGIRVIAGSAAEIPFDILVDNDSLLEDAHSNVALLDVAVSKGKYQQFICDLGSSGIPTNRLTLVTPSRDFAFRADIEGSNDRKTWLLLAHNQHVFNWSEGQKLSLEFPDTTDRFVRFLLWLDGGKPIELTGVKASRTREHKGQLEEVSAQLNSRQLMTPQKLSEWIFDFGHEQPLVNRCTFEVTNRNFSRVVDLATSDDLKNWSSGPHFEIYRRSQSGRENEFTTIQTNALEHRYLRIRIQNGDDRPLEVSTIKFLRFVHYVVFEFEPGNSYRLFYGNPDGHTPSYDLSPLAAVPIGLRNSTGTLGPQETNPDYLVPVNRKPWTERHPEILWIVLVAVVLIMGIFIVRSLKTMGKEKPE